MLIATVARLLLTGGLVTGVFFLAAATTRADDDFEAAAKAVQGKWMRKETTRNGPVVIVKEHRKNQTLLVVYDKNEKIVYSHQSEFRVEKSERVWLFTFGNRKILAGPDAGKTIDKPSTYIYRVVGEHLVEVQGMLTDDKDPPRMIIWRKFEKEKAESGDKDSKDDR